MELTHFDNKIKMTNEILILEFLIVLYNVLQEDFFV